jgi:hypothetical protein
LNSRLGLKLEHLGAAICHAGVNEKDISPPMLNKNDEASTSGDKEAIDVPIDTNQIDVIILNEQPKVDLADVAASIEQTNDLIIWW